MNTYRKMNSNKITFTQAGVIETPRNRINTNDGIVAWVVDQIVHLAIVAGGLATVYMLIIR